MKELQTKVAIFEVRVIPRASRSGIAGCIDGVLKIKLSSAPADGAANEELVKLLAKSLGVPTRSVEIVSGQRSRKKIIKVIGLDAEAVLRRAAEAA